MTDQERRTRVDDLSPKRSMAQGSSAKSDHVVDINLDLDPDLMLEVDIPLDNTDRTPSTHSRRTSARTKSGSRKVMSAGNDKNCQSARSHVYIKTRARPMKPHEVIKKTNVCKINWLCLNFKVNVSCLISRSQLTSAWRMLLIPVSLKAEK